MSIFAKLLIIFIQATWHLESIKTIMQALRIITKTVYSIDFELKFFQFFKRCCGNKPESAFSLIRAHSIQRFHIKYYQAAKNGIGKYASDRGGNI
jgi:hypothetical protein